MSQAVPIPFMRKRSENALWNTHGCSFGGSVGHLMPEKKDSSTQPSRIITLEEPTVHCPCEDEDDKGAHSVKGCEIEG